MKATVITELCIGCGLCESSCPEVFEMEGTVAVAKAGNIPEEVIESAKQAATNCPTEAIKIED